MPLPYPYPYDSLGTAGTNRIVNEVRVITPPTDPELANWIMPAAAPFHSDSVIMRLGPLPTDTALTFGVDYVFTHYFVSLSQHIAKPIYGSIKFLNRNFSGSVYLTYQTVGGPFTVADTLILENLSRSLYNISTVTWDQIQGVPQFFPPAPHQHDVADMTGMADVVTALNSLVTAIAGQNGNIAGIVTTLQQHIASLSAHTPAAVGLGNVPNFAVATLQDVLDAVSNKLMTPERTLQQVTLLTAGLATAAQVAAETIARQNADTALQQAIDNEATTRQNADTLATQALATESTSRQNADASLHSEVVTETNARVAGDQHLQDQIDSLSAAAGGFASQTDLNNEITNRQSAVSAEATARANADTTLQNNIDSEATARANADTDLQNQINAITGTSGSFATTAQLTAEATTRYTDDQALQSSITAEANTRGNAIAFEFSERVAADALLQSQIDGINAVVSNAVPQFDVSICPSFDNYLTFQAHNGGWIWVAGKNRQFTGMTYDVAALTARVLHSVFLWWNGTNLVPLFAPIGDTTFLPRRNNAVGGIVMAYNKVTNSFDNTKIFIGHVYRNTGLNSWDRTTYRNMGTWYVRSYHHDCGTMVSGFYEPSPTPEFYEARPYAREGRVYNSARLMAGAVSGLAVSGDLHEWGIGAQPAAEPSDTLYGSLLTGGTYPVVGHADLLLGYIVWPYEVLRIKGQFNTYANNGGSLALRAHAPSAASDGSYQDRTTVIERGFTHIGLSSGSALLYQVTALESMHYTDAVFWSSTGGAYPGPELGGFRTYDMVWSPALTLIGGNGSGGASRLIVEPVSLNRNVSEVIAYPGNIAAGMGGSPYY